MKRTHLVALIALAIAAVAGAAYVVQLRSPQDAAREQLPELFPGIADQIAEVDRVLVERHEETITLERTDGNRWTIAELDGYWAQPGKIQVILNGFVDMETREQLTANPEMHGRLGLADPGEGSESTRVTLESEGSEVASLILGNTKSGWQTTRQLYVRRAGENQTWLVRSPIEATGGPLSFRENVFLDVSFTRVLYFENEPYGEQGIEIRRQDLSPGASFMLLNIPEEADVTSQEVLAGAARSMMNLSMEEIRRAPGFFDELTSPSLARLETRDGLFVEVALRADPESGDWWATVLAEPGPTVEPDESVLEEIDEINARTEGWAYRLSSWRAEALLRNIEEVITRREGTFPGAFEFPGGEMPEAIELPEGFEQYFMDPEGRTIQIPQDDESLGQFLRPREQQPDE